MKNYGTPSSAYAPEHGGYPGQHPADTAKPCDCGKAVAFDRVPGPTADHGTAVCRQADGTLTGMYLGS